MEKFVDGNYELSGIGDVFRGNVYGVGIILDGITYLAYEDKFDGYRSFGCFERCDGYSFSGIVTFPPQVVRLKYSDTNDFKGIELFNVDSGKLILKVGSCYYYDYYPYCCFEYSPENLPINC